MLVLAISSSTKVGSQSDNQAERKDMLLNSYRFVMFLVCVLLVACGGKPPRPMLEVGALAPYARFEMTDGQWLNTDDFKGKNVALQFWAADCTASGSAIKKFNKEANRNKGRRDRLYIAVSADTDRALFEERVSAQKLDGPLHAYSGNGADDEAYVVFGVKSLPQGFVIDRYGTVVATDTTASLE